MLAEHVLKQFPANTFECAFRIHQAEGKVVLHVDTDIYEELVADLINQEFYTNFIPGECFGRGPCL